MSLASAPLQLSMAGKEALLHSELDDEHFFSRGPTTLCPVCKCLMLTCRCYLRNPREWRRFPSRFQGECTLCNPCASKPAKFASIFKLIRALAEAAPWDIEAMQAVTDLPVVMPWLGFCCHQVFGSGVALSPASIDVMPTGLYDFVERGVWLFPEGQGRIERNSCGCGTDIWHRLSYCCCCCIGGFGGCDGTLRPPLPDINPKVILHFHGGAFALTNAETYPWLLGYELVRRTGAVVLFPDYTRPPRTNFGGLRNPLDDCLRLYKRLLSFYGPTGILVMGDSAGGNLALSTVLAATQEGLPAPAGLVLISPWVDLTDGARSSESWRSNGDLDFLPRELAYTFAKSYCDGDRSNPLVSPVLASDEWLRRLPPTMLTYGTHEILRSQQEQLRNRLDEAGRLQAVYVADEMPHVATLFAAIVWGIGTPAAAPLPPAVEALQKIQEFAASVGYVAPSGEVQGYRAECASMAELLS